MRTRAGCAWIRACHRYPGRAGGGVEERSERGSDYGLLFIWLAYFLAICSE
jgi:hypothetical protein